MVPEYALYSCRSGTYAAKYAFTIDPQLAFLSGLPQHSYDLALGFAEFQFLALPDNACKVAGRYLEIAFFVYLVSVLKVLDTFQEEHNVCKHDTDVWCIWDFFLVAIYDLGDGGVTKKSIYFFLIEMVV